MPRPHYQLKPPNSADGWTHVTHQRKQPQKSPSSHPPHTSPSDPCGSSASGAHTSSTSRATRSSSSSFNRPPPPEPPPRPKSPIHSLQQLHDLLSKTTERWRATPTRQRLVELFHPSKWRRKVQKVVCLGLGTPSADVSAFGRGAGSVLWQLVVLLDLVALIASLDERRDDSSDMMRADTWRDGDEDLDADVDDVMGGGKVAGRGEVAREGEVAQERKVVKDFNDTSSRAQDDLDFAAARSQTESSDIETTAERNQLTVTSGVGKRQGKIQVYAQDPIFNETDIAFLSQLGINVLKDPEAWKIIDQETLVFAPHFPLANAEASLYFGTPSAKMSDPQINTPNPAAEIPSPPTSQERLSEGRQSDVAAEIQGQDLDLHEGANRRRSSPAVLICNDLDNLPGAGPAHVRNTYTASRFVWRDEGRKKRREDEGLERAFEGTMVYTRRDA
ncbi:MAG: hypothetical protein Q9162_003059 [Coniocarpon cinnabarinum]